MKSSATLGAISPALVKALGELRGVAKDSRNVHFKNDYASLEAVIETARPVLAAHGLAFMQGLGEYVGGAMTVSTRILHESGEWIESDFQMPVAKSDPQGTASASTYARRYSLMGILGLPAVDDDGEAATAPARAVPDKAISQDQADALRVEIEAVGADPAKFLAFFKIKSLEAMPAGRWNEAVAMLEAKRMKGAT
jgi:hypothetical protein